MHICVLWVQICVWSCVFQTWEDNCETLTCAVQSFREGAKKRLFWDYALKIISVNLGHFVAEVGSYSKLSSIIDKEADDYYTGHVNDDVVDVGDQIMLTITMLTMIYDDNDGVDDDDDDVAKRTWEERPKLFITGFEPWAML